MTQPHSSLQGFSLPSFLQLIESERQSCLVRVTSGGRSGRLYFRRGHLFDAETGGLVGLDAVYEIVKWPDTAIEVEDLGDGERPARIQASVFEILLRNTAVFDEARNRGGWDEALGAASAAALPAATRGEATMNPLQQILDRLRDDVPEFVCTDIVNYDSGLSIGGRSLDTDFDASVAAATYAEVVKSNRRALELLGLGADSAEDVLITTERLYILIRLLGASEYYQFLVITRRGNLGLARAIMKKHVPALLRALGELV